MVDIWELSWDETMSVEIAELDEDHKLAAVLLQRLEATILAGDREAALAVHDGLRQEMEMHFRREEWLLAKHGYPLLGTHKTGHRLALEILGTLRELLGQSLVAALDKLSQAKLFFLERLILDDLDYKWFFLDRGIKADFSDMPPPQTIAGGDRPVATAG